ncbi:MAG: hypothetical protein PHF37_04810, partial [Phycisphaerae bacterium]|nr:hypothetical protein [Phycisphaerae bacterium]
EISTAAGNQQNPAVWGDCIVWQDYRDDIDGDIYMARRPSVATVTVVWPNGGETLMAGKTEQIVWQNTGNIAGVKIEYYDDPNWVEITTSTANTGTYDWDVAVIDSNQCKIKVSDAVNPAVYGESDAFTVFVCDPNLTADINKDCFVDWADFAAVSGQWLDCGNNRDPAWCDQ